MNSKNLGMACTNCLLVLYAIPSISLTLFIFSASLNFEIKIVGS